MEDSLQEDHLLVRGEFALVPTGRVLQDYVEQTVQAFCPVSRQGRGIAALADGQEKGRSLESRPETALLRRGQVCRQGFLSPQFLLKRESAVRFRKWTR